MRDVIDSDHQEYFCRFPFDNWVETIVNPHRNVRTYSLPPLAQIERDVAGEVERIAAPDLFLRDLVHGPALHKSGVPVDEDAALHVGAAHKAGAVDAPARLAAPAVLCAQIPFGLLGQRIPECFLAAAVPAVKGTGHKLFGPAPLGQRQCFVKAAACLLGEPRRQSSWNSDNPHPS